MQDVLWSNVGLSGATYLGAALLAWTLFALLAIFYLIPVGAVQALLQVDKLEKYKFFRVIMDVSAAAGSLAGLLCRHCTGASCCSTVCVMSGLFWIQSVVDMYISLRDFS